MSIEKAYNSWAGQYDTNDNKTRDLDKNATIDILSKYNFDNVLELGCGTGKNTAWLVLHAKKVISLDFSKEMLAIAREKIGNTKVNFVKTDINVAWEVPNGFANLITSSLTLEHIENLNHIFQQAALKLKPEGIFFISELHPIKQYLGSKARYETNEGTQELEVYIHHVSDYTSAAKDNGFELVEINECFDENEEIPRLISFVFKI